MTAPAPSCKTCMHSGGKNLPTLSGRAAALSTGWVLWCVLQNNEAVSVCEHYSREPGSDDQ